jgi:hypothetical protein
MDGTAQLLERMLPLILARPNGWVHAINRCVSDITVAAMEATDIPIDAATLKPAAAALGAIKNR